MAPWKRLPISCLLYTSSIAAIVAIVGLFVRNLSKKETHKAIGDIMFGFTILMIGMSTMKAVSYTHLTGNNNPPKP